jgi:hypothetical protein
MNKQARSQAIRSRFYALTAPLFLFPFGKPSPKQGDSTKAPTARFHADSLGEINGGRKFTPAHKREREPAIKLGIPRVLRPSPLTTMTPKLLVKPKRENGTHLDRPHKHRD